MAEDRKQLINFENRVKNEYQGKFSQESKILKELVQDMENLVKILHAMACVARGSPAGTFNRCLIKAQEKISTINCKYTEDGIPDWKTLIYQMSEEWERIYLEYQRSKSVS